MHYILVTYAQINKLLLHVKFSLHTDAKGTFWFLNLLKFGKSS